ncbi:granzyme A-like isoform X1 [Erpetoichthys calabaricus]|uniref:trypsin n=1 Tax=Erpetoichthys calabaricus TaxID=27687 RepID=A0A8C4X508_ERPCA|nr:granzyme A-like isoform X1 [Erpetoichthys calabaricus]
MKLALALGIAAVLGIIQYNGGECSKIVGGVEVKPHSRPFMAFFSDGCGGALIKEDWVLTAAHCFECDEHVVLGGHFVAGREKQQQRLLISNIVMYPGYSYKTNDNDIMLIQLNRKATLNKYVSLLELPASGEDVKNGEICTVTGWGDTQSSENMLTVLREVNVTGVSRETCNTPDYYNGRITENMFCAGEKLGGKDSCQGDSGGPIRCSGIYRGIVSFGDGCALPEKPGVYTLLTDEHLDWIKKTISA